MIHVGFTGTRAGMSYGQLQRISKVFALLARSGLTLHHGDCVGADFQAHAVAVGMRSQGRGVRICVHPPLHNALRAFTRTYDAIAEPLPYLARNYAIVDHSEVLYATPREDSEVLRSGTWATVRHARNMGKKVCIITRAGELKCGIGRKENEKNERQRD